MAGINSSTNKALCLTMFEINADITNKIDDNSTVSTGNQIKKKSQQGRGRVFPLTLVRWQILIGT